MLGRLMLLGCETTRATLEGYHVGGNTSYASLYLGQPRMIDRDTRSGERRASLLSEWCRLLAVRHPRFSNSRTSVSPLCRHPPNKGSDRHRHLAHTDPGNYPGFVRSPPLRMNSILTSWMSFDEARLAEGSSTPNAPALDHFARLQWTTSSYYVCKSSYTCTATGMFIGWHCTSLGQGRDSSIVKCEGYPTQWSSVQGYGVLAESSQSRLNMWQFQKFYAFYALDNYFLVVCTRSEYQQPRRDTTLPQII